MIQEGWYEDPTDASMYRYWDGTSWTTDVAPKQDTQQAASSTPTVEESPAANHRDLSYEDRLPQYCRACGAIVDGGGVCPSCQWPLGSFEHHKTLVGQIFLVKERMRKRRAICVEESEGGVVLHIDSKPDRTFSTDAIAHLETVSTVESDLSAAGRLTRAAELATTRVLPAKWDTDRLQRDALDSASGDAYAQRQLFDEALRFGWADVVNSLQLTSSEKAWRRAHDAASKGHYEIAAEHMAELPEDGYPGRVPLALITGARLSGRAKDDFRTSIGTWSKSLPNIGLVRAAFAEKALAGKRQRLVDKALVQLLPHEESHRWKEALASIGSGVVAEPPVTGLPLWETLVRFEADAASELHATDIANLPLVLVDDAIDGGRVSAHEVRQARLDPERASYLLSRLDPNSLELDELRTAKHLSELARRFYYWRDSTSLFGMATDDPAVGHYQALHSAREGEKYDPTVLRSATSQILEVVRLTQQQIREGETSALPDEVITDSSLWGAFRELALRGQLQATPNQRLAHPRFAEWLDLHRLVELLWSSDWRSAEDLGMQLATTIKDEILRDEALNLLAFAQWQQGRAEDALVSLEDALEGDYTEALLINTSILAAEARPEVAATYLNRLVAEAPTSELRLVALRRAIQVWAEVPDLAFADETRESLRLVLHDDVLDDEDYYGLMMLAARQDAAGLVANPPPPQTGARAHMHRYALAHARAFLPEGGFDDLLALVDVLASINSSKPKPDWFEVEAARFLGPAIEGLETNFGESLGSAAIVDRVIKTDRSLITDFQYFFAAPQSGAHYSTHYADDNNTLSDEAAAKFFYLPCEVFMQERDVLPEDVRGFLERNFRLCLRVHLISHFANAYPAQWNRHAENFRSLNDRRQWDDANHRQLTASMRGTIDARYELIDEVERILARLDLFAPDPDRADAEEVVEGIRTEVVDDRKNMQRLGALL